MRLVSYAPAAASGASSDLRAGVVVARDGDRPTAVVAAGAAAAAAGLPSGTRSVRSLLSLAPGDLASLAAAATSLAAADPGQVLDVTTLRLGPPVPDPDKIVCLGLNYRDHAAEAGLTVPTAPMLFAKYRNALVGPDDDVPLPAPELSDEVDYEGELALVIGRAGVDLTLENALDHVAGYMVLNDVSARDLQSETGQWLAGKTMDGFAPCGPCLVTVDEVADPGNLRIVTTVNGESVQDGTTADMVFGLRETLVFLSRVMSLEVGDVVATGTPAGVGSKMTPPRFLRDGDVVDVDIPGVGRIANRFTATAGIRSGAAPVLVG